MDFAVLGPLTLHTPAGAQPVQGRRQRALLATLLARTGRTVPSDDLVDALWPEEPPRTAEHTLHTHVSRLRRSAGVPIVAADGGYRLDIPPSSTDAGRFEHLVSQARTAPPAEAVTLLREALALWHGPAFGAAADLPGVRAAARRLEELRRQALEHLVTELTRTGRASEAVTVAEALVGEAPARETAWIALVESLVAAGRPADGVAAYHRAAAALDELGLLPSAGLSAAHLAAVRPVPNAAPPSSRTTPAESPSRAGRTLPILASSFIGRAAELALVDGLLDTARVVTLVGPGGVGKTRLALEVLRHRSSRHASGARIVELTTLSDPGAVPAAMVAAIGVTADGDTSPGALRRAGGLDVLVLLDNCEHVIDALAESLEQLLHGDRVRVLATSRERLGVPGETVVPLAPLPVSGAAPPARDLFLERAAAAGLGPAAASLPTDLVDHLVETLDGLPLAIEMAAARTPLLGLRDLADSLDRELGATAALRSPYRGSPERHRTLRAVIAWSEALLDPEDREALEGWPVFAGAVDAEDAQAVLGAGREVIEGLVLRSLLTATPSLDGSTRYRMLHTVRSAILAGDHRVDHELRRRHAGHFAARAARCSADLRGPGEASAVAHIAAMAAELRAAHLWCRANAPAMAASISAALQPYAVNAIDEEVLGWGARLLGIDAGAAVAATAQVALAAQLTIAGELEAATARAREALALATDDLTRLHALEVLSDTAIYAGRLTECREWSEQLADLAVACGDPHYLAMAAGSLSLAHAYAGDADAAASALAASRERLARVVAQAAPTDEGWLLYTAGEIAIGRDPAAALRSLDRAVELADQVGNRYLGGVARVSATSVRAEHGDPGEALAAFADVIRWWLDRGDRTHLVTTLRNVLDLLVRVGADVAAAELWGTVGHDRPSPSFGVERRRLDATRAGLAARLGTQALSTAIAAGASRDVEEAAHLVLSVVAGLTARR